MQKGSNVERGLKNAFHFQPFDMGTFTTWLQSIWQIAHCLLKFHANMSGGIR